MEGKIMVKCPVCESKNLLYYPKGYKNIDRQELCECLKCETQFNQTNEGKVTIIKRGSSVLLE